MHLLLFLGQYVVAQSTDSLKKDTVKVHKSFVKKIIDEATKKRRFLLAPELGRTPQTGFYTGIYYLQLFKIKGDTATRTSNIETFGTVTEKSNFT